MKPRRFELAIEGIEYYDADEMDSWLTDTVLDALQAKDELLVCYRAGRQPTEALFRRLEKANALIKELRDE